jgi:hypothetical protein
MLRVVARTAIDARERRAAVSAARPRTAAVGRPPGPCELKNARFRL